MTADFYDRAQREREGTDVFSTGISAHADADRALNLLGRQTHGYENVRGLDRSRGASGTRRYREAFSIECKGNSLPVGPIESKVGRIGGSRRSPAVGMAAFDRFQDTSLELVSEIRQSFLLGCEVFSGLPHRFREPHDSRDVLRTWAARSLLTTPTEYTTKLGPPPNVERADSLGSMKFVSRKGEQIYAESLDVDANLAAALHRVAVEIGSDIVSTFRKLVDRLDHSRLVVRHHDRDEQRVGPQVRSKGRRSEPTVFIHVEEADLEAALLKMLHGVQHRGVLDHGGYEVTPVFIGRCNDPQDGEIVRLRPASREDDVSSSCRQERGHGVASFVDRFFHRPAESVKARGVAKGLAEVRKHCIEDLRGEPRSRVVVQINR